jgi:uncharacterized protein YbjT (DUF2867 family)
MRVLLTGANGYIGRRLKHTLLEQKDVTLRLLVRNPDSLEESELSGVEIVQGNSFDTKSLEDALEGVDVAYYLIHSLQDENYRELDKLSAQNFREAAIKKGVKKIIYLGGLGRKEKASTHLLSRIETGEELSAKPDEIQTIWIRAGVIIGSGSASFEIIRHLTEKLPIMVTPKWVKTIAQPIGVDDVIIYLESAKDLDITEDIVVDIGTQKMSYKKMMLGCATALGLYRTIIPLPVLSIKLSSYWLNLFTPVPYNVAKSLVEGLSSEVIVQNDNARKYFPHIVPNTYEEALEQAVVEMQENQVLSRWSDAGGGKDEWEQQHKDDPASAILMDRQTLNFGDTPTKTVYKTFCSIGGEQGWFAYDWLWEIRGWIDKILGGAGLNRGRRDPQKLRVGESVDFWRVEKLVPNQRLLLRAQMKVPGRAWLEFTIVENTLIQTAYFYPKGLWGRTYWYALTPIHYLVFRAMIKSIVLQAQK